MYWPRNLRYWCKGRAIAQKIGVCFWGEAIIPFEGYYWIKEYCVILHLMSGVYETLMVGTTTG